MPEKLSSLESPTPSTASKKTKGRLTNLSTSGPNSDPANETSLNVPKLPRPCGKAGLTRKQAALDRLKVSESKLARTTPITKILKEIPGGKRLAFEAMQLSEDPLITEFLDRYFRIPDRDRICLPIEAVALAAKINPKHLLGEILMAMREHSATSVKVIALSEHPDVMRSSVENAKLPGGYRDREMVHTMLGALSKQGPTFINKFFAGKADDSDDKNEPEQDDPNFLFPDASEIQEKLQAMRQRLLETRK